MSLETKIMAAEAELAKTGDVARQQELLAELTSNRGQCGLVAIPRLACDTLNDAV